MVMQGADADELEMLAQRMRLGAAMLQRTARSITAQLNTTAWQGRRADAFRAEWSRQHTRDLYRTAAEIALAADLVRKNASEQRSASAAGGPGVSYAVPGGLDGAPPATISGLPGTWKWERSDDPLFSRGRNDDRAVDPEDIVQGGIGNCFVLANLKAIARADPDAITRMIVDNGDGTYTVTLYDDLGHPRPVIVTDEFPTRVKRFQFDDRTPFSKGGDGELWVRVIEKAYLQEFHGGYGGVPNGGYTAAALFHLTGQSVHGVTPDSLDRAEMVTLADGIASGRIAATTSSWSKESPSLDHQLFDDKNIVSGHAYAIERIDMKAGLVHLDNPHGRNDLVLTIDEYHRAFRATQWTELHTPQVDRVDGTPPLRFA